MKTAMMQPDKRLNGFWLFVLLMILVQGCAKYKEFEAVFPAKDDSLASYDNIAIDNRRPGDPLYQQLENALKAQFTSTHPGNVKPIKDLNQIEKDMSLFNYNPKVESIPESRIATVRFTIKATESVKRDRRVSPVMLRNCNYLKKRKPCSRAGTSSLARGYQTLNITLSGVITLKNSNGERILADFPIKTSLTDSGRLVPSPKLLVHQGINQIANEFARRIIPHRERIKSEILKGGDSVAVKLIEHDALNLAVNRLDKLVSQTSEPQTEDLYNLGLAYEALGEVRQALEHYQRAEEIDPGEKAVSKALKRVRRIIKEL